MLRLGFPCPKCALLGLTRVEQAGVGEPSSYLIDSRYEFS